MKLIKDLGTKYVNKHWIRYGKFECSHCFEIVERELRNGKSAKSCGCVKNKEKENPNYKHGESKTRLYIIWNDMKYRCSNPKAINCKDYGGRGITICPEWTNDYTKFRDWALNNGYNESLQIDRKENEGNYEPSNCRFVTSKENSNNRRSNKIKSLEIANEIRELDKTGLYTRKELAMKFNVHIMTISRIINNKIWRVKSAN